MIFHTCFKKDLNYYRAKLHVKSASAKRQDYPFFIVFPTIKTSSQNISIKLLQISLKRHERRGSYWGKKLPRTILGKAVPSAEKYRMPAASKISIGVIWLL